MASFSVAAVWGPALRKNPNMPWPCESTRACTSLSACGNSVLEDFLHWSWPLSSLPAGLQWDLTWELISLSSLLKDKQFLTSVMRGRGSTFILSLHLAGCVYALFLKTGLGTLVTRAGQSSVCMMPRGLWGKMTWRLILRLLPGNFIFLIFAVCCNLVPPKGNNLLHSGHFIRPKEKFLLCWETTERNKHNIP